MMEQAAVLTAAFCFLVEGVLMSRYDNNGVLPKLEEKCRMGVVKRGRNGTIGNICANVDRGACKSPAVVV